MKIFFFSEAPYLVAIVKTICSIRKVRDMCLANETEIVILKWVFTNRKSNECLKANVLFAVGISKAFNE